MSGPGQAVLVHGSGSYDTPVVPSDSEGSCVASRARRGHAVDINSIVELFHACPNFKDIKEELSRMQGNLPSQ